MRAAEQAGEPVADHELPALFTDFARCRRVLLAVSGGPDSVALLFLARRWRSLAGGGPVLSVATVDHRLRPQARREAAGVAGLSRSLGVPHRTLVWSGTKPKTGVQEAAREARYRLLVGVARKLRADAIATAHTLDDQAETFMMRLARGSGVSGLAGIPPASSRGGIALLRPLLTAPKSRLVATLRRAGIPFNEDPSNLDPGFTRVRMRKLLARLAPEGFDATRLSTVARRLGRADRALEAVVDELERTLARPSQGLVRFAADLFFRVPEEISLRLLGRALDRFGNEGPVELAKLESLHAALCDAHRACRGLRRTLAGGLLSLDATFLTVSRAPSRRNRR